MNLTNPDLEPHEAPQLAEQDLSFDDLQKLPGVQEVPEEPSIAPSTALQDAVIARMKAEKADQAPVPEVKPIPEVQTTPEAAVEQVEQNKPELKPEEPSAPKAQDLPVPVAVAAPVVTEEKSETRKEIESILQAGIGDIYLKMQPSERQAFLVAANETASKLEVLVGHFKATAKEILRLIRILLNKIPRVNQYFLEQASKIKTDEILEMQKQKKKQSRLIR